MNRFTGSQLPRFLQCVGAAIIPWTPRVTLEEDEVEGGRAERGVVIHDYLENVSKLGLEQAIELVPEGYLEVCLCLDVNALPATKPDKYSSEVQLAWSPITRQARLGMPLPGELGGKLDIIGVGGETVYVDDYKTGSKWLGKAALSAQLRAYALMAARTFGCSRAEVSFIRINQFGEPKHIRGTFEAEELDVIEGELVDLYERILVAEDLPLEQVPITEGAACHWCPAFARCPAKRNLLAGAAGSFVAADDISLEMLGQAWVRLKLVQEAAEEAEKLVKEALTVFGAVPLPNGNVLVRKPHREAEFTETGKEALTQLYGPEAVEAVVERKEVFTMKRFDKYVADRWRDRYGKKGTTEEVKRQRKALELAKGLRMNRSYRVAEVSPADAQKIQTEAKKLLQETTQNQTKENEANGKED